MSTLSHVDEKGRARMVDVTAKETTVREAVAWTFDLGENEYWPVQET